MKCETFNQAPAPSGEFNARDEFNVVILYDRAGAGRRAMARVRNVTGSLADGLDLHLRLWRLDVIMDPAAATTAATDLATADLLVLALADDGSLKEEVHMRLQEAVRQMCSPSAAIAILANDDAATGPPRFDFLRQAAEQAGVGLLFPPVRSVPAETEPPFAAIHGRATAMTHVLEGILNDTHSRPRWDHDAGSL